MLKQVLHQVLKQNPSKSQAKFKQRQGQCLKALVETLIIRCSPVPRGRVNE